MNCGRAPALPLMNSQCCRWPGEQQGGLIFVNKREMHQSRRWGPGQDVKSDPALEKRWRRG